MKKILIGISILIYTLFGLLTINNTVNAGIEDSSYMINTDDYGMGSDNIEKGSTAKDTIENGLEVIVNKLMIGFGVLALFIMTVGGGYMIFAHGQDELLNKGKSIFSAGIISLLVALGSGIIMKIVIYLLY